MTLRSHLECLFIHVNDRIPTPATPPVVYETAGLPRTRKEKRTQQMCKTISGLLGRINP